MENDVGLKAGDKERVTESESESEMEKKKKPHIANFLRLDSYTRNQYSTFRPQLLHIQCLLYCTTCALQAQTHTATHPKRKYGNANNFTKWQLKCAVK